jgi:hypothetical protein
MSCRRAIACLALLPSLAGAEGGIYGWWSTDEFGLPAFRYTFDQVRDPRSPWPNSEQIFPIYRERRDHFQLFGNGRVNAMAVDHGYVSLYGNERGATWMNRFAEGQRNLGGGFSYVRTPQAAFCTAYLYAPETAETSRTFGLGYFETQTAYGGVAVLHRVYPPFGDDPLVLDEVRIQNLTAAPLEVQHTEYWDVNRHQLQTQWIRTGLAASPGDELRDRFNGNFLQSASEEGGGLYRILRASMRPKPGSAVPPREQVSAEDWYPPDVFLAALGAPVAEVYTDQARFFGSGGPALPEAVAAPRPGEILAETDALGQPALLAMRSDLSLAPGEARTLRFAYGYLPQDADLEMLDAYRDPESDLLAAALAAWKQRLAYVSIPGHPDLERKALWRSHQLRASSVYLEYYGRHVIPQGSTYLYLHGADGVPRD